MISLSDPLVQLKITCATCSFFALGSTLYRLYQRRGRFGADDLWAVFAFVALIVQVVAIFLHIPPPNNLPKKGGVAVFYLTGIAFYAIVWGSRLSILFSIIRIDPTFERRRRLFWVAVAFIVVPLVLLAQLFWVCEGPFNSWKNAPNPGCHLPLQVAVFQLINVISDSILLFAPLPLFRDLNNKALRRKLTLIFSTCVVTTIVSLVHAFLILRSGHIKVLIAALVEDSVSLIVANIPVVITTMIDIVGEEDQFQTSRTPTFSSIFWYREPVITRVVPAEGVVAVELPVHLVSENSGDRLQLRFIKAIKVTSPASNQNDLESGQAA